jgi:diguanylate cyclase (GGDEF)-like protein
MQALTKQIPLLYFLLITNSLIAAYTHYPYAPLILTVYCPAIFTIVSTLRLLNWRALRFYSFSPAEAIQRLRSTIKLTSIFGVLMTIWGFCLLPYGGIEERTHIAFYMSITTVACVFCLTQLRPAAITLALIIVVPFALYFASLGNTVMTAIAINMVLVVGAMLYTLFIHYGEFTTMVDQRLNLENINAETLRLSNENHRFANMDSLTGLPNRRRFFSELESAIAKAEIEKSYLAVGLIDLDGFKAVNDLYGHLTGDKLLVEASKRMLHNINASIFVARLGGDEFGFIMQGDETTHMQATKFGQTVCETLRLQYSLGDIAADVSASCGIATYPENSTLPAKLMEFADYALYQAKSEGVGGTIIFAPAHYEQLKSVVQINHAMRNANLDAEFYLEFQPILRLPDAVVSSYEALARWQSPVVGKVPPSQFIATAERSNMIDKLTIVLFKKFLGHLAQWPEHISASFNLSARNLASTETALQLVSLMNNSKVAPSRIEFEVTETAVMADFDQALRTLKLLRNMGAKIALDDFGSGYSSLGYVHRLPLDKIKIDRSFVSEIQSDQKVRNIVKTIVDLCRNLGVPCVAEGVETAEQANIIIEVGCTFVQGYYFGRPMASNAVLANGEHHKRLAS